MGFNSTALALAAAGISSVARYVSAHASDPGSSGTGEVTGGSYARQQTTWTGDNGSQVSIPIPSGTHVTYWGLWSASSDGTFYGGFQLSGGGETFTNDGNLLHTPTLVPTAS